MLKAVKDLLQGKASLNNKRSPQWPTTRANYIKKFPTCAVCGGSKNVEVHHKKPFHLYPELELVEANLISLCESGANGITCHLFVGHLGNYKTYNPMVERDAKIWRNKISEAKKFLSEQAAYQKELASGSMFVSGSL